MIYGITPYGSLVKFTKELEPTKYGKKYIGFIEFVDDDTTQIPEWVIRQHVSQSDDFQIQDITLAVLRKGLLKFHSLQAGRLQKRLQKRFVSPFHHRLKIAFHLLSGHI